MWEVVVVAKPGGYGGPAPKSKIGEAGLLHYHPPGIHVGL